MRKVVFVLALVFVLGLNFVACGVGTAEAAPMTIKLSGAFAEGSDHYFYFDQFCKTVEERSNGTLKVVWGHGPEAIPSNKFAEAMQNGLMELIYTPLAYVVTVLPAFGGVKLTDPATMRASGGVEYISSLTEDKLKARYLARMDDGSSMALAMKAPISSIADFKGKTIRGTSATMPLIMAVGAEMATMGWSDVYQALDKNVVAGAGGSLKDFADNDLDRVITTLVLPGVYISDSSMLVANHIWAKMDSVQQAALNSAAVDWEVAGKQHNEESRLKIIEDMEKAGVKVVDLGQEYVDAAYASGWKVTEESDAGIAAKLKSFAGM